MPLKDPVERAAYHKEYMKKWYAQNKRKHQSFVKVRFNRLTKFVASLKKRCACCEETHPACLEFHHRDPSQKKEDMALVANRGWSEERILVESSKCEVLCSNCHRKMHWNTRNGGGTPIRTEDLWLMRPADYHFPIPPS